MLNLDKTTLIKCESCNNKTFVARFIIRKRSEIISNTGKDEYITVQVLACSECGNIPEEYQNILADEYI